MLVSAFYHGKGDAIVDKRLLAAGTVQEVPPHILLAFVRVADYDESGTESQSSKHVFLLPGAERQFGFVLQRGEAWWCVLSHSCFVQLFYALLDHLVGDPEYLVELNETPLPKPGRCFPPRGDLVLKLPKTRFAMGEVNCRPLFEALPCDLIGRVLLLLMLERRVVLHSTSVGRVSLCVHAFVSLLYPFTFDHLLFFILPGKMADYLCAPFPYFCGLHSSAMDAVQRMPLDAVAFCDLDRQTLGIAQSDLTILPPVQLNALVQRLERLRYSGFGTVAWNQEVQEAFLSMQCSLMASYRRYYIGSFDKEGFLADCPGSTKRFFAQFLEAQMFSSFLDRRKEALEDEFERRCAEMTVGTTIKDLGKAINSFVTGGRSPGTTHKRGPSGTQQQQPSGGGGGGGRTPQLSPRAKPGSPQASPRPVVSSPRLVSSPSSSPHVSPRWQSSPSVSPRAPPPGKSPSAVPRPPPIPERSYLKRQQSQSQSPQSAVAELLGFDDLSRSAEAPAGATDDLIAFDVAPHLMGGDLICLDVPDAQAGVEGASVGGNLLQFE